MQQTSQGIRMCGISKDFFGKSALKNVDITIREGSVHAIVGENGAGKSTLMNILSGALTPSAGTIEIDGAVAALERPQDALKYHIGMVHQHFMLIPTMTAWQNIVLGIEPTGKFHHLDKTRAKRMIAEACETYKMALEPDQLAGSMTVGEQQRIEILKVLVREAKYIILDEPTAVLTPQETEQLFKNIRSLQGMGKTVIFISHKLEEVMEIADEIMVLRLGEKIATLPRAEASPETLIRMMVGRDVRTDGYPKVVETGEPRLAVRQLCTFRSRFSSGLDHLDFEVRQGEILGIAGVDGNGQTELVNAILGMEPVRSGNIELNGNDITGASTTKVRASGLSLVPPDRHAQGLVLDNSVTMNMVLGCENDKKYSNAGLFRMKAMQKEVASLVQDFDVRTPSLDAKASELSGGNQQKLIFARETGLRDSAVLLAVNPTRGLDVGAIEFVYAQMEAQKALGKAILLVSTELTEIMRLSDRIAVLYKGRCMGILPRETADIEKIGALMMGINGIKEDIAL